MARKTFISYKYNEALEVRERIIASLGQDATYYKGETVASDDLSSFKAETIKQHLKEMLFDTSVTIVVISPHMKESEWIDWEIEYSLCEYERNGIKSHTNGLVGVIMKYDGGYDWFKTTTIQSDSCRTTSYSSDYLFEIIKNNRFNQEPVEFACSRCHSVPESTGSYISFVEEETFLAHPHPYIENAFEKSQRLDNYSVCKSRSLERDYQMYL